ncbi:DEAD/DEAH box helicase [Nguyenibacter vanlangensis]|uniref:DEAD/DEAH box helicase n=1 Tax=Nguyenibacter vanlangensis TaxID=1216886 RepID=A0ABZ3D1N6_9PROT
MPFSVQSILRDYQARVAEDVSAHFKAGVTRVLVQMSTGAGKTVLAAYLMQRCITAGRTVYFLCHRDELVAGTSRTLLRYGIPHGVIAAGHARVTNAAIQVCSIGTLKSLLGSVPVPWLVIVDETHHSRAEGWETVIDHFTTRGARLVGLTATPKRLDNRGLGAHFDAIVCGPTTRDLIDRGHLSRFRHFFPPEAGTELVGDPVDHWRRLAAGLRTVVFAKNVAHSRWVVKQFCDAGIPAAHLDGGTPRGERREIIRRYAAGELLVLSNVDLFGEGFDLAAVAQADVTIDCVMMLRRTKSLSLYLQWAGRGLRPAPGKTAVILDHAGNWYLHDDIDADRDWTLGDDTGAVKRDGNVPAPFTCPQCFGQVRYPYPMFCPTVYPDGTKCGHQLRKQIEERTIEFREGELREMAEREREAERWRRKSEDAEAQTLAELTALGRQRGYKDPHKWAFMKWSARNRARRRGAEL